MYRDITEYESTEFFEFSHKTSLFDSFSYASTVVHMIKALSTRTGTTALLTRVPPLVDNEGGVKLRMLHTPSPGNLVLPLLGQFLLLRNIEVHGAMSETGASQPLNLKRTCTDTYITEPVFSPFLFLVPLLHYEIYSLLGFSFSIFPYFCHFRYFFFLKKEKKILRYQRRNGSFSLKKYYLTLCDFNVDERSTYIHISYT